MDVKGDANGREGRCEWTCFTLKLGNNIGVDPMSVEVSPRGASEFRQGKTCSRSVVIRVGTTEGLMLFLSSRA